MTLKAIYTNWTSTTGEFLFPIYEPGSEFGWVNTVNGVPLGLARELPWFEAAELDSQTATSRLVLLSGVEQDIHIVS